jgi:cytochrome b
VTGGVLEAHGIGGQADLPISLGLAISGAVAALVISFTVLVVAWRTPRYPSGLEEVDPEELDAEQVDTEAAEKASAVGASYGLVALRLIGLVGFVYTALTAVFGENQLTNPFFGIVYVWLWVGIVFASVLFGPVWRAISPMRTINAGLARISGGDPEQGVLDYPAWLGHWPAAIGLYAFVWMELVNRTPTDLGTVRLWCAVYVAAMLVGGAVFGSRFYENADPFEVYSTLVGSMSVLGRDDDGRFAFRSPLAGAATIRSRPGLVAVVAVLFGSTAFDSFSKSTYWLGKIQQSSISGVTLNNLALLAFCLGAGLIFAAGSMLAGLRFQASRSPRQWVILDPLAKPRHELPRRLAHSIVPIVAGYIVAHYLTLFIDVGTQTLARASDPFGKGWDILGTAGVEPSYWFSYHPSVLATLKVAAVVLGHITAAVLAHDRAIALLPRKHQITGQLPLLAAMVTFTAGGLYLLFSA